ncbi:hypothetical protein bhDAH_001430 (plasmid) [Borrelia hermsii DAH]|nr:hypothetical protein bhDAH_001430 [Borrelia hermsii DAH]
MKLKNIEEAKDSASIAVAKKEDDKKEINMQIEGCSYCCGNNIESHG